MTPEEYARQQAALAAQQKARQIAEAAQRSGLQIQEGVTPAIGVTGPQMPTPAQAAASPTGMPPTAVVTSVGFQSTAGSGGGGGGGGGGGTRGGGGVVGGGTGTLKPGAGTDVKPQPSNPLAREGGALQRNLDAAAQNYRNLVSDNASPADRAAAKQEYANALNQKAAGLGQPTTASQAFGIPERNQAYLDARAALPKTARELAAAGAYPKVLAEKWQREFPKIKPPADLTSPEANRAYYNNMFAKLTGENPYMIGDSTLAKPGQYGGGMKVTSVRELTAARNVVNEHISEAKKLQKAERRYTAKGEFDKAMDMRKQRKQLEAETRLKDPANPKAGWDVDSAVKNEIATRQLLRDESSLSGLAQKDLTKQGVEKAAQEAEKAQARVQMNDPQWVAQRKAEEAARLEAGEKARGGLTTESQWAGQEDLVAAIERQRLLNEMWLEDQRKRTIAYR